LIPGGINVDSRLNDRTILAEGLSETELLVVETAIEVALRRVRTLREIELSAAAVTNPLGRLTARERDVLRLIAAGYSNKEAGCRLNISARTVEVHREHVMEKFGASNIVDLVNIVNNTR
jgi:DNA-binding CsgD family transcriptional regulator